MVLLSKEGEKARGSKKVKNDLGSSLGSVNFNDPQLTPLSWEITTAFDNITSCLYFLQHDVLVMFQRKLWSVIQHICLGVVNVTRYSGAMIWLLPWPCFSVYHVLPAMSVRNNVGHPSPRRTTVWQVA